LPLVSAKFASRQPGANRPRGRHVFTPSSIAIIRGVRPRALAGGLRPCRDGRAATGLVSRRSAERYGHPGGEVASKLAAQM